MSGPAPGPVRLPVWRARFVLIALAAAFVTTVGPLPERPMHGNATGTAR